jgi:hypothetical protein
MYHHNYSIKNNQSQSIKTFQFINQFISQNYNIDIYNIEHKSVKIIFNLYSYTRITKIGNKIILSDTYTNVNMITLENNIYTINNKLDTFKLIQHIFFVILDQYNCKIFENNIDKYVPLWL